MIPPGANRRATGRDTPATTVSSRVGMLLCLLCALLVARLTRPLGAQAPRPNLPALTEPVNDFAKVIDPVSAAQLDRTIRALQAASGDVVVVATVPTIEPYADLQEYAVKLFENRGRGIGERGNDNGLLIVVAPSLSRVQIEVGYGLESWITDGYAGDTIRDEMRPEFRAGRYGAGLVAGTTRLVGRIAQGRYVQLVGVDVPRERRRQSSGVSLTTIIIFLVVIVIISRMGGGPGRGIRRWGGGGRSGWSSGVGPFGGAFGRGGDFGGGGFGGGFGGFGGGQSGGGGAGGGW